MRALNYNEHKVQKGVAECILAANYLREPSEMNLYQKLDRFEKLIELNQRAKTNSLHISLNFDPSDQVDKEKLSQIASLYMEKIGFKDQPYLVYQHHDAAHPHLHIVTTTIRDDGKRINTFNIGRNQSEAARKEIEMEYGFVVAGGRKKLSQQTLQPINVQKAVYGKCETKQAITNVLDAVIDTFKYTSLAELNAVLRQYNVVADRGKEGSTTFKRKGLVYRIVDAQGNKVGVPIKASSIYSKPTLNVLESKFAGNEARRKPDVKRLKTAIDWTLTRPQLSLDAFIKELKNERTSAVVRQSDQGMVYGLTYIDWQTKAVFNGSDIGKEYSAKGILDRLSIKEQTESKDNTLQKSVSGADKNDLGSNEEKAIKISQVFQALFKPPQEGSGPSELNQAQKRKKKKTKHH